MSDSGLSIAASGLQAQRAAMDATAENLANINTPGYLREQAQIITAPAGDPLGIGDGTMVTGVTQASNAVLAANALAAGGTSAAAIARQQTLTEIQAIFPEPSTAGLSSQLSTFWSAWDAIANNPSQTAPRTEVINQAQNLAANLNQAASQLAQTADNTTTQLDTTITQVNHLLTQVAALNQSIVTSQAAGTQPTSLIDQRNSLVNQLGSDIGVTTRTQSDGSMNVYVGGLTLVQGNIADQVSRQGTPPSLSIVSANSGAQLPVSGGAAAGLLSELNTDIPAFQAQLDGVAQQLATTVNTQLAAGYDATGASGASNPMFVNSGWTSGPVGTVTATSIAVNPALTANPGLIAAATSSTNYANDGSNAAAMAQLFNAATGPDQSYRTMITDLGSKVQSVNTQVTTQGALTRSLQATLQSVTGVNSDQETVNMLSYQQAYQASAKVISTISSMVQSLLAAV
ncbi:MAG: flagellar hook-associated protein FlgK [Acidimicrobiales bacterium]